MLGKFRLNMKSTWYRSLGGATSSLWRCEEMREGGEGGEGEGGRHWLIRLLWGSDSGRAEREASTLRERRHVTTSEPGEFSGRYSPPHRYKHLLESRLVDSPEAEADHQQSPAAAGLERERRERGRRRMIFLVLEEVEEVEEVEGVCWRSVVSDSPGAR